MQKMDDFFSYDHLAVEPLGRRGWDVVDVPWSGTQTDWSTFDAVVIRSPWDYQNSPDAFLRTLAQIESSTARLFNPLSICRWNLNKSYLRDIQSQGVPIVPTTWLDRLDTATVQGMLENRDADDWLVAKPMVGANADGIHVLKAGDADGIDAATAYYQRQPVMVQPFLRSVQSVGEYSLFYFAGNYSHAIIKRPKQDDFRVQEEHGGTMEAIQPSPAIRETADAAVDVIGETLLYARVDLVLLEEGSPAVIELELIEPSLYFPYDPESPGRFADALDTMWDA